MRPAERIDFAYRRSGQARVALVALSGIAAVAVLLSGIGFALQAACLAIAITLLWRAITVLARGVSSQVVWQPSGGWSLALPGDEPRAATLAAWSRRGPLLVLRLSWSAVRGGVDLVLLPDNLDRDTRRRLLVRLRREAA